MTTSTAAAMESTSVAAAAEPPLLREWSYPSSPEPPVAPAVVLKEEESSPTKLQQISQSYSYPVATFVSNFMRSSVGHIYDTTGANENIEEGSSIRQNSEGALRVTSIRTDPGVTARADTHTLRSVVSDAAYGSDEMFDEAEFVIVDGDLVAVPAPPPNEEEMEAFEEALEKKNCKNRGFRRLGKWIKKRTRRTSPRNVEETIDLTFESPATPQPQGKRKHKRNKKKGRRSRAATEEEVAPHPVIPVAQGYASSAYPATAEAHLIGTADELYEAGVLPACTSADAYFEEDEKIDELASTRYVEAQKVDRVENLLTNALFEQQEDDLENVLESSVATISSETSSDAHKSCSGWPQKVPLSKANSNDPEVYNDTLKVVMVGAPHVGKTSISRALRKRSSKKPRRRSPFLGVDVHSWTPKDLDQRDDEFNKQVKFSIWDVNDSATAGAHPATQSLFFSESSLYVLVWDMAANNDLTLRIVPEDYSEEEDDLSDDFLLERHNRQADSALEIDIQDRVLSWVDQIAASSRNCAILPVATLPEGMDDCEAQRRCSMMQALLMHRVQSLRGGEGLPVLVGETTVLRVNLNEGVEELKEAILDIATSRREQQFFDHMGIPVPKGTVEVLDAVRKLRKDNNKVVLVDHLLAAGLSASTADIAESLRFLSAIGEVLYFGTGDESDVLSRYVVLCRKWLVSALSCILCSDLHNELAETRTFMNMQCEYSGQHFTEGDVTRTLLGGSNSNCPILSSSDASMLWQSMSFMREAADRSAQASSATSSASMFEFLKKLLVHSGVLVPLSMPSEPETKNDEVFFVPSLLPQAEPSNVWTYKTSQSWTTTLCHSWLLRDRAPSNMMERIAVSLLEDLYGFSRSSAGVRRLRRSKTCPLEQSVDQSSLSRAKTYPYVNREEHAVGQIKIHQVMCWKSSLVVNIGCFFEDPETGEVRESVVEVFVSLADQHAHHCVASNSMGGGVKKLIVCGKGQSGHDGRKLWKGGYRLVLDSIKASVSYLATGNVQRQVVCPECLSQSHHSDASTWNWDCVRSAVECGNSGIRCIRGHLVDANLLCGTSSKKRHPDHRQQVIAPPCVSKPVSSLLGGVVVVGLWDARHKKIRNVGSGFVVDAKQGLIVTAAHILFDMSDQQKFGSAYWGLKDAKAVIGVIPKGEETAVFRYFAEILTHDVQNMDACVLRITTKFEKDVGGEGEGCADQPEIPLLNDTEALKSEHLQHLRMTRRCELEEKVRILGFNQGGEGILEQGKHVNRCVDFAKGYVCKKFKAQPDDNADKVALSAGQMKVVASRCFTPREEIVVICPTISGHSGGPCVNDEGKVIGILSRADPADRQRCYLVPTSELKKLVKLAKAHCARKPINNMYS